MWKHRHFREKSQKVRKNSIKSRQLPILVISKYFTRNSISTILDPFGPPHSHERLLLADLLHHRIMLPASGGYDAILSRNLPLVCELLVQCPVRIFGLERLPALHWLLFVSGTFADCKTLLRGNVSAIFLDGNRVLEVRRSARSELIVTVLSSSVGASRIVAPHLNLLRIGFFTRRPATISPEFTKSLTNCRSIRFSGGSWCLLDGGFAGCQSLELVDSSATKQLEMPVFWPLPEALCFSCR